MRMPHSRYLHIAVSTVCSLCAYLSQVGHVSLETDTNGRVMRQCNRMLKILHIYEDNIEVDLEIMAWKDVE
jgi:hypothetical protein